MTKEDYNQISRSQKLPLRCPIYGRCMRMAWTIYFFSYHSSGESKNVLDVLKRHGEISDEFEKKLISLQGDGPTFMKSNFGVSFSGMCPEVNLDSGEHALSSFSNLPVTDGSYDKDLPENKRVKVIKSKHYTECKEFCKYYFEEATLKKYKNSATQKKRVGISRLLRMEIFQRDNFTCQYCGKNSKLDGVKLEIDHKLPVSEGGTSDYHNLITSCEDCNRGKSNKIIRLD